MYNKAGIFTLFMDKLGFAVIRNFILKKYKQATRNNSSIYKQMVLLRKYLF